MAAGRERGGGDSPTHIRLPAPYRDLEPPVTVHLVSFAAPTDVSASSGRRPWGSQAGRRGRFHRGWGQALRDTVYILSGFVLATLWWSLLASLLATGLGLLITLVGLPILVATMYLWIGIADTERWRARALLGIVVERPYRALASTGWLRRAWERSKDPAVWRDLTYLLLVFFPLAIVTFVIAVTGWAVALGLLATPAYYRFGGGIQFGDGSGLDVDTLPKALVCSLVGLVLLALLPWILGLLVTAHAFTVRTLLGRRSSERVEQLTRQRTDAVDAAVAERRRIERDLHDGAQQRLTALAIDLGRARSKLDSDPEGARALVEQAHEDSKQALAELRNLARGIHPAILTDRGLDAALSALAARSPVPVEISVDLGARPPVAVESTAYFVVAEALTNAAKHSGATRLGVRVRREANLVVVEVEDDGVGGARIEPGGGLEGLTTRVATVDGTLTVSSPTGGPTIVRGELPCAS
jgi:signal transduction histidine kinase